MNDLNRASCANQHTVSAKFQKRTYTGQNSKSRILSVLHQNTKALTFEEITASTGVVLETVKRSLRMLKADGHVTFTKNASGEREYKISI